MSVSFSLLPFIPYQEGDLSQGRLSLCAEVSDIIADGRTAGNMAKEYAKAFYKSIAWQRTREAYARSQGFICERCGAIGEIVHHKKYITPGTIDNSDITLSWDNLELLCSDCHNKEHKRKSDRRFIISANGSIVPLDR